jgi:hypothetical protein
VGGSHNGVWLRDRLCRFLQRVDISFVVYLLPQYLELLLSFPGRSAERLVKSFVRPSGAHRQ